MPAKTIILIGLRASGKTTVGRLTAAARHVPFADLDDRTTTTAVRFNLVPPGSRAADVLRVAGAHEFRNLEAQALLEALNKPELFRAVIALGGGTPTHFPSLSLLQARQRDPHRPIRLVYLRAAPATLRARLQATDLSTRPSLTGQGVLEEIDTVFAARDPLYRSIADSVIEVDGLSPEQSAAAVLQAAGD